MSVKSMCLLFSSLISCFALAQEASEVEAVPLMEIAVPFSPSPQPMPTPEPTPIATPSQPPSASVSIRGLEWSGDLRYRMAQSKESIDDERPYQQLRARLGLKADVNQDTRAILRLATGTSAISTNQTLGDAKDPGMSRRSFGIDLAYIDMGWMTGFRTWLGRTANPFWSPGKSQIMFDSDLAFEGVALKWDRPVESVNAFVNIGGFMISENYSAPGDVVDTALVGGDLGAKFDFYGSWTAHLGSYHYLNIQGRPITSVDKDAKIDAYSYPYDRYRGNTVFPNDPLLPAESRKYFFQNPFVLHEIGLEWKKKFEPIEITLFYDRVQNDQVSNFNTADEYGLSLKWRRFNLGYAQSKKESDSVVASFTDSDMNGGGTDNKGSRWNVGYQMSANAQVAITEYKATRGLDSVARDYAATQLDLLVSF